MSAAYVHVSHPRSWSTLITVIAVWAVLLLAWILIEAAPWVLALIGLFTLPALYDLWANPRAELTLTDDTITWSLPRAQAEIAFDEIDHVRLDTRLDFSVKATLVLNSGRKLRVPVPATPPHQEFETALQTRGVQTRRHHFSLIQ